MNKATYIFVWAFEETDGAVVRSYIEELQAARMIGADPHVVPPLGLDPDSGHYRAAYRVSIAPYPGEGRHWDSLERVIQQCLEMVPNSAVLLYPFMPRSGEVFSPRENEIPEIWEEPFLVAAWNAVSGLQFSLEVNED